MNRQGARSPEAAMPRAVAAAVFAASWLLWSGHYSPLMLAFGLISCVLVMWLALRIGFFDLEVEALTLGSRLPRFWVWLLKEIVLSNVAVVRVVVDPRLRFTPSIVRVDARALPAVSQAVLANAITLTPGTLTMDTNGGLIEVHCLTHDSAEALRSGEMLRRAAMLRGP